VSDFAEAMVQVARRHAEDLGLGNVECRVLDAEQLDLDTDSVEQVWADLDDIIGDFIPLPC
jgi:ubiquinone/menaquinone biosynthesis C-methylase UbiE